MVGYDGSIVMKNFIANERPRRRTATPPETTQGHGSAAD